MPTGGAIGTLQNTRFVLADPRRSDLSRHATYNLQFHADTDVALIAANIGLPLPAGFKLPFS